MGTYRDAISNWKSANKVISADALITDRAIMNQLKNNALVLIKQRIDKRLLYQSPNLFTNVPCLEMKQVPLAECCEYTSEALISRSVQKLPKIAEAKFGLLIQRVTGIDFATKITEATPTRYINLLRINPKSKSVYFWILNDYLYITNPDLKRVSMAAYFQDEPPSTFLCPPDCDCRPVADCDPCQNPMDREFRCPGDLLAVVEGMVSKYFLETYFNVKKDTQSDQNDQQSN